MALRLAVLLALFVSVAHAASPHKEPVTFSYTGDVGFGNSVFVVGNNPDIGNWDVTQAIKLHFTAGNVWSGQIAIQAGTLLDYRFISRATANSNWCASSNATYLTTDLFRTVSAQPDTPYHGKAIYYLSAWNPANLFYNNNGTWTSAAMTRVASGRSAGESLFKISGIGVPGEQFEFVFTDGNGNYDNPAGGGNYLTNLDVFEVQDGNVFSYQPAATVSTPQIITHFVDSTAPNIPGRNVHVYLPRGYTQNATRRYPVLYLHDGQNVFDPGGTFGSWSADATATREIGHGRMRETIMVGIDNDDNRIAEYLPPGDSYKGSQGISDVYASFVINNVRPYLDNAFRTLNDSRNTLTLGSSLGGLVSVYLGREFPVFGKIGALSSAFWAAPNYVAHVAAGAKIPIRVYLDFGTAETADDWDKCLSMYDLHLAQGYSANADLLFGAGCGQAHNEAAWAARLPTALRYLLPAREDPAELAQREFPPTIVITELLTLNRSVTFGYTSLFGFAYTLEHSPDLVQWSALSTSPAETMPWSNETMRDPDFPSATRRFWKLQATPAP